MFSLAQVLAHQKSLPYINIHSNKTDFFKRTLLKDIL